MLGEYLLKSTLLTKRNLFYLNIAIGIIVILSVFLFIRDIISVSFEKDKTLKTEKPASKDVNIAREKMQLMDYSLILKNNPFGFPAGEIRQLTTSTNVTVSQADIILLGTVVGPKEFSYGVFKDKSGMQEIFKIGESVFGLGMLSKVEKDKVAVRQGGNMIEILLEDVKIREIKKQIPGSTPSTSTFAQKTGIDTYIVDQRKIQEALANPTQMMGDARLRPNAGREGGFILSEVKPGGIYHSLGLQNGDIILRINEYEISTPERALQAFTALKGLDRVQLDIIRTGSKMTMTYQIR
jgi:general secretion pathway protein C